jgi:hypothetical protein
MKKVAWASCPSLRGQDARDTFEILNSVKESNIK